MSEKLKQDFARPHWGVWFKPYYQIQETEERLQMKTKIALAKMQRAHEKEEEKKEK